MHPIFKKTSENFDLLIIKYAYFFMSPQTNIISINNYMTTSKSLIMFSYWKNEKKNTKTLYFSSNYIGFFKN